MGQWWTSNGTVARWFDNAAGRVTFVVTALARVLVGVALSKKCFRIKLIRPHRHPASKDGSLLNQSEVTESILGINNQETETQTQCTQAFSK